jgi:hypothetical protein
VGKQEVFVLDMFRRLSTEQRMQPNLRWCDVTELQYLFTNAEVAALSPVSRSGTRKATLSGMWNRQVSNHLTLSSGSVSSQVSLQNGGAVHTRRSSKPLLATNNSTLLHKDPSGGVIRRQLTNARVNEGEHLTAEKLQSLDPATVLHATEKLHFKDPAKAVVNSILTRQFRANRRKKRMDIRKTELLGLLT